MNLFVNVTLVFTLLIQSTFVSASVIAKKFNSIEHLDYGVQANNSNLDYIEQLLPDIPLSRTGKSFLTVNKTGFDVLNSESQKNWVLSDYKKFISKDTSKTILDIGSGYGRISHIALDKNKTVIANDIAIEHLLYTRKIARAKELNLNNLYLNNSHFPNDIAIKNDTLDAVVLYRIIHFLSSKEIELGLENIHKWLRKGGQVFIVVLAPQHKEYSNWFLPTYNSRWASGNKWPGEGLDSAKALPLQKYNLPKYLHVMDERPLKHALEKQKFTVVKTGFVDMRRFGSNQRPKRDGRESFGIIAMKN